MINSIQHFQQNGVKRLLKIFEEFEKDLTKMAEMVYGVTKEVTNLGCSMIAEGWESYDEILRKRKDLRKGWYIVRRDETTITTSLGDVTYSKTLFKNTKTGNSCYLLDKLLEIEPHTRMSEDAIARMLEETVDSNHYTMEKEKPLIHCILMQMRIMYRCSIWKRRAISRNQELIQSCLD